MFAVAWYLHLLTKTVINHSQVFDAESMAISASLLRRFSDFSCIAFPQGILNGTPRSMLDSWCYYLSPALRRQTAAHAYTLDFSAGDQYEHIWMIATEEDEESKVLPAHLNSVDNVLHLVEEQ